MDVQEAFAATSWKRVLHTNRKWTQFVLVAESKEEKKSKTKKKPKKTAASLREPEPDPHLCSLTHSSQVTLASNCSDICSLSWPLSLFLLLHLITLFALPPLLHLYPQPGLFPLLVRCYLAWLAKLGKDSIPPRGGLFLHNWHVASSIPGGSGKVWIEKPSSNVRRRRKKKQSW